MVHRELYINIWKELAGGKSMVFMAGPRQSGKTTLAKIISRSYSNSLYFNWDIPEHSPTQVPLGLCVCATGGFAQKVINRDVVSLCHSLENRGYDLAFFVQDDLAWLLRSVFHNLSGSAGDNVFSLASHLFLSSPDCFRRYSVAIFRFCSGLPEEFTIQVSRKCGLKVTHSASPWRPEACGACQYRFPLSP